MIGRCPILALALPLLVAVALPSLELQAQSNVAVVHRLMLDEQMVINEERAAALADLLNHNDVIQTSANTRAAVRFTDDGSLLRVNPASVVQIRSEGEAGSLTKTIELEFGELWARVQRRDGQEFHVETPSGVAAVRGTEFIVQVGADGETMVITLEGLLDFFNDTGTIEVPQGFQAQVGGADEVPTLAPVDDEQLQQYAGLTQDDGQPDTDLVEIQIPGIDGQGRPATVLLRIPRSDVGAMLGGGGFE